MSSGRDKAIHVKGAGELGELAVGASQQHRHRRQTNLANRLSGSSTAVPTAQVPTAQCIQNARGASEGARGW
jgi:hypothetical protein